MYGKLPLAKRSKKGVAPLLPAVPSFGGFFVFSLIAHVSVMCQTSAIHVEDSKRGRYSPIPADEHGGFYFRALAPSKNDRSLIEPGVAG